MTRGRLVWPGKVKIAQLDVPAMADDTDHYFGTPPARVETETLIEVSAQIETGGDLEGGRQRLRPTGDDPTVELRLVVHYADLEDAGLVDNAGAPKLYKGDRLVAIYDPDDVLVREYPPATDRKALYCVKVEDDGFGLSSRSRNLLLLDFATRDLGTNRTS